MAKLYLERGIKPRDLEQGIEFEVDHEDQASDSGDDTFCDKGFEEFKREINEIGIKSKELLLPFKDLKEVMHPVTEDCGIMKQVIKYGVGIVIPDKSVVMMHYDAFLEDKKNPFDSTRLRNRPYKFLLGNGNVIPGLDLSIKTMKKEEISKILISSEYAYGEMGCPPRIPGNAQILYVVEILNFYESKDVIEFEEMTLEEQKSASFDKIIAVYHCEHQLGNELFHSKQYKSAIARYRKMVKILEDVSVANEEEDDKRNKYLLKLYINLSLCYCNIQNSSKAIIYADLALKLDENNVKAMYRMGCALSLKDEYAGAKKWLIMAKQRKPHDKYIIRALIDLEHKKKLQKQWETGFYKRMFASDNAENTTFSESSDVKEFRNVLQQEFEKFINSDNMEISFSSGYTESQIEIVKQLAREYNLSFTCKIQNDSKIIKVSK